MDINSSQAKMSKATFGETGKSKLANMTHVSSDNRGLSMVTAYQNDSDKEKLDFLQA